MSAAKEEAKQLIDQLPEDVSWREVLEELEHRHDPVTLELDEVHAEEGPAKIDPWIYAAAFASLPKEPW